LITLSDYILMGESPYQALSFLIFNKCDEIYAIGNFAILCLYATPFPLKD